MPSPQRLPVAPLALLTASLFGAVTTEVLPVGLLPQLAEAFDVDRSRIGWWVSAYAIVVALGAIPLTAWLARFRRRRVLIGLLSLYALSNAAILFAPGYGWAVAVRLLGGVAHAGIFSVVVGTTVALVAPGRRGRALAVVNGGVALALAAGVPLGTALGEAVGWRWAFGAASILLAGFALAALVVLPRDDARFAGEPPPSVLTALRGRRLRTVALGAAVVALGHFTAYTYITPIVLAAGVSQGGVSTVLFGYGAASFAGLIVSGNLVDRYPGRSLAGTVLVVTACLLAAAAALGSHGAVVVVLVVVWGAAFGGLPTLTQTAALRASRDSDAAPAVINATFNVGIAGGAWLGGLLLMVDLRVAMVVGGVLAASGLLAFRQRRMMLA
ncbi:MFS transporter [Kineococcus sp. GCM10028916]|uniref:MFS transporter n=1 Tax=Kineococcus sp. GCM10028916 TaxID=3273394 RepID=UPI003631BCCE